MEKLRLLFLVASPGDAELLSDALKQTEVDIALTILRKDTGLIPIVASRHYDAIIAFNLLPEFSALRVLHLLRDLGSPLPLVLVSSDIVKDNAIAAMKAGAADCISVDELHTLGAAVQAAVSKRQAQAEKDRETEKIIESEALMAAACRLAKMGSWESDLVNNVERWSDEQYRILWLKPGETEPALANLVRKAHPEDVMLVTQMISDAIRHHRRQKFDFRILNTDGQVRYVSLEMLLKRDANDNVVHINGCLWDVSDARIAEQKDKRTMADLQQRNKDLEQFAYIISHNLRAPVANIVGVSTTLMEGNLDRAEEQEFIGALSASVKKLDSIITDLNHILQVKRHVSEKTEPVNFAMLVEEIKSSIGVFLEDQCIMIATDLEVPEIVTLKSYMRSIFYNLISNSIKYCRPGLAPVIEIKSRRTGGRLEITFRDNSIGIDMASRGDEVFGLYKRFNPGYAEGKGMGLFMVKTQVETLGGRISVQSKVNEGAEFKIEFEEQKRPTV